MFGYLSYIDWLINFISIILEFRRGFELVVIIII